MDDEARQRLNAEYLELCSKIDKLRAFIGGEEFSVLPPEDSDDLAEQLLHMIRYRRVLSRRVARHYT